MTANARLNFECSIGLKGENDPTVMEIRAEFLKDFLSAANSGMILLTFQSRHEVQTDFDFLGWESGVKEVNDSYRWEGHLMDFYEDGLFSGGAHVVMAGRKNVDFAEDVPRYEFPDDGKTWSESYVIEPKGPKLVRAMSEIWKQEWITPATASPRVAGDEVQSTLEFIVDNEGRKETSQSLKAPLRWLWFHPEVVNDLLNKPTSLLQWYRLPLTANIRAVQGL